jgi:hypothetical protein
VLFGLVMRGRPGTLQERSVRRVQWQIPEGVNVIGEYWFPTDDPSVVAIVEAEDANAITPIRFAWDDVLDTEIFPITPAEEGLELLRQMMPAQG